MPYQMYKYFKQDSVTIFDKSITSAKLRDKPASEKIEISQVQKACLDRNQRQKNIYYKEYNLY